MTVNTSSWKRFALAERDTPFDADDAIARIAQWANGSVDKFKSAFLWQSPDTPANNKNSYRLPVIDIMGNRAMLIPRAVFSAAQILSGGHGGLEGVVSEEEKLKLKGVATEIYAMLEKQYGDPRVKPPWLRGGNEEEQVTASLTASVNSTGWSSMPLADQDTEWSADKARKALSAWADGDMRQYRRGFLWWDSGAPEQKNSYKLPIATVVEGKLVLVPRAVRAVAQVLAGARGGVDIPDDGMDAVAAVVHRIQERLDSDDSVAEDDTEAVEVLTAGITPVAPPRSWFENPELDGPTPIAVTSDGQVMGHLAAWGTCHTGFGNQCVMAPRSAVAYKYFLNGTVVTADGGQVRVGKITVGTGHADRRWGWIPASDHYDHTGKQAAIVAAGEDRWGIWVAGAMVPEADDMDVAMLRRSPLSGDWRRINGNLELVAALAVNTPGFPVVNLTASGDLGTLCAAGVILEDGTIANLNPQELTESERTLLARLEQQQAHVAMAQRNKLLRRYSNLVAIERKER